MVTRRHLSVSCSAILTDRRVRAIIHARFAVRLTPLGRVVASVSDGHAVVLGRTGQVAVADSSAPSIQLMTRRSPDLNLSSG